MLVDNALESQLAFCGFANWRSRSFKVIDFCCNRKPTYDLL